HLPRYAPREAPRANRSPARQGPGHAAATPAAVSVRTAPSHTCRTVGNKTSARNTAPTRRRYSLFPVLLFRGLLGSALAAPRAQPPPATRSSPEAFMRSKKGANWPARRVGGGYQSSAARPDFKKLVYGATVRECALAMRCLNPSVSTKRSFLG
nr:hypothetical protein [Tanacetum cinerariifolium]